MTRLLWAACPGELSDRPEIPQCIDCGAYEGETAREIVEWHTDDGRREHACWPSCRTDMDTQTPHAAELAGVTA